MWDVLSSGVEGQGVHCGVVTAVVDFDGQFGVRFAEVAEREPEGDDLSKLR